MRISAHLGDPLFFESPLKAFSAYADKLTFPKELGIIACSGYSHEHQKNN